MLESHIAGFMPALRVCACVRARAGGSFWRVKAFGKVVFGKVVSFGIWYLVFGKVVFYQPEIVQQKSKNILTSDNVSG
jgi:hypothetical protein